MDARDTLKIEDCQVVYDGTYEGLLTVVFECYRLKLKPSSIKAPHVTSNNLFANRSPITITTNFASAERVMAGIQNYGKKQTAMDLYKVYHSEDANREMLIYGYLVHLFRLQKPIYARYHLNEVLRVAQWVKKMGREIHRMHAFVRFQELADGMFFAPIEPDFDVLPFTYQHFVARYSEMRWCIYDIKRHYGMYNNHRNVTKVVLEQANVLQSLQLPAELLSAKEQDYQQLWKDYFNSTNIEERKNIKLHLRHVPTRYWKYLTEKQ